MLLTAMCCAFLGFMLFRNESGVVKEYMNPAPKVAGAYADRQVGERFEFGRYPQGVNGEVKPITWRVLRRDDKSLLVIAEQGLDCKRYNEQYVSTTWASCTLRRWLNEEFIKRAFSEQEQSSIKTSEIPNNAGPPTKDLIFLLSVDEASSLFTDDSNRICKPTDYAVKNGVYTFSYGNSWWWLRSRGSCSYRAALVSNCGFISINGYYVIDNVGSVRPALRLTI